ncbi:MAG: phosphogluconate dehydrogenase (NADP(+)-dependent, decarboxylating) [Bacteroidetes bacterium]|nr:MAG: phosphogluconate dehydrogenase (NADP(+)-dependent, decarboxylating) [Bacteroidota bacterium]PTM14914.1 MAG: phosphogluconate dehydrogenase (NADP(+)-dependent, decarboxylating) [Bacteroidota bacterium]
MQYDFGMIGLGVMGRNFLLNVADHGFAAAGLDLDADKAASLNQSAEHRKVLGTTDQAEFLAALRQPRTIMLLVPAGKVVDSVIDGLLPHLSPGDLLIDGGNSFYEDTARRAAYLQTKNIQFLGVGVSGGEEGARRGPSIMPGGDHAAWERIQPILEAVAAKVDDDPCVAYMGKGPAGHYVKMVHNGIEYGLMQLIAEAYDLLKQVGGLSNQAIHQVFSEWNKGPLQSFLIEITAEIFAQPDDQKSGDLIDVILDKAKQKGTGKWTSQSAMDLGVPVPTIDAAVTMRGLSALWSFRQEAAKDYGDNAVEKTVTTAAFVAQVEQALLFAFILTYAQGLHLLAVAGKEMDLDLRLADTAKIWRGGCIIRAELLEDIRQAYVAAPDLENLLGSAVFRGRLKTLLPSVKAVVVKGVENGIPLLALASTLHYFEALRTATLPLNLVQAQRDFFGAHTYERLDATGVFHTSWGQE